MTNEQRLNQLREEAWEKGVVAGHGVDVVDGPIPRKPGYYRAKIELPPEIFLQKTYGIKAMLYFPTPQMLDCVDCLRFEVQESASFSSGVSRRGILSVRCGWDMHQLPQHKDEEVASAYL